MFYLFWGVLRVLFFQIYCGDSDFLSYFKFCTFFSFLSFIYILMADFFSHVNEASGMNFAKLPNNFY